MNGHFDTEVFYKLIFDGFKFNVKNDELKVAPPNDLSLSQETSARKFIYDNKFFIIDLINKNNISSDEVNENTILSIELSKYPLSFAQERLWFIEEYESGTYIYNVPLIFTCDINVDIVALRKAIFLVIERHEILRTLIKVNDDGEACQYVLPFLESKFSISEKDVASISQLHQEFKYVTYDVFNLQQDLPIRVSVFKLQNQVFFSIVIHHSAFDGWSIDILLNEINTFYNAFISNSKYDDVLPPLAIQYKDFAYWQRQFLTKDFLKSHIDFFKSDLTNFETLNLPTDKLRPTEVKYEGDRVNFEVDEIVSKNIKELSRKLNVSLFSVLISSFYLMLHAYSGQNDIIIGTLAAGRGQHQIDSLIGFFVNNLPLRIIVNRDEKIKDFIIKIYDKFIETQLYQNIPFEKLIEHLDLTKDASRHPLFQVVFALQRFGKVSKNNFFEFYEDGFDYKVSKFDLMATIDDSTVTLRGEFNYSTNLFNRETIERYVKTYLIILKQISELHTDSKLLIKNITYLSNKEIEQLHLWNQTNYDFNCGETVNSMFTKQASRTPQNIAYYISERAFKLTYEDLDIISNKVANYLLEGINVSRGELIAVCLERSQWLLVAILGILKAGCAYVPLDLNLPNTRLEYILNDTKAKVIFVDSKNINKIPNSEVTISKNEIVSLDLSGFNNILEGYSGNNPNIKVLPEDLAYVIYTSGTTGKPKGVMLAHQGIVNRIEWMNTAYPLKPSDKIIQKTPTMFDVSVWELFWANWYGASIVFAKPEGHKDPAYLFELINNFDISVIHFVPSMLDSFLSYVQHDNIQNLPLLGSLRYLFCSGEALNLQTVLAFKKVFPHVEVHNLYGPTEASIDVLAFDCNSADLKEICIGRPIFNTTAMILNEELTPLPIGAIGELYIGGVGLATGYLNLPELSASRFIDSAYGRLYRTGDLVRQLDDGNILYIGRNDFQVKIRGFRVELGDIESTLLNLPEIQQVAVVLQKRQNIDVLIAYYVSGVPIDSLQLKSYLTNFLPEYMIPNIFMHLNELPLTFNGKLDRNALPKVEFMENKNYVYPKSQLEISICNLYSEILNIPFDNISTDCNIFDLGMNSILLIKLKIMLEKKLDIKNIGVAALFKHNTISKLATYLLGDKSTQVKNLEQLNKTIVSCREDIAVIGVSCEFPGSEDVNEFWQNIIDKRELVNISADETFQLNPASNKPNFIFASGVINGINQFDPDFWKINYDDARHLNPQTRKLLEHAWKAIEASGYIKKRSDLKVNTYLGASLKGYKTKSDFNEMPISDWQFNMLNNKDFSAARVSYHLGLNGEALSISTACSTSLVAIIEACKNLQLGTCNLAIAGGVSLSTEDAIGYLFEEGMILSKDGHCRVFDAEASGTVPSSGVGVVVLKRLSEALADQDDIIAVIKGYATNNDGNRKVGFSAPSVDGQKDCILDAQLSASVSADSVSYVECHGTGTLLGDPIEVAALHEAFTANSNGVYDCQLGSVKANIGHADVAAGIAGFIKTCMMLRNKKLPAQINYVTPNIELSIDSTNFSIKAENRDWLVDNDVPRRAGVSSFGIGGTNAHLILEEFSSFNLNKPTEEELCYFIPISANSASSCIAYTNAIQKYLMNSNCSFPTVAKVLQENREYFNYRVCIQANSNVNAIEQLAHVLEPVHIRRGIKLAFMFTGQGFQYSKMAYELYVNFPYFKVILDQCAKLINEIESYNILEIIFSDDANSEKLKTTQYAQPALFIICYALAKLYGTFGIEPSVMIGHSVGEIVAATLSGIFSLEDAIKIILMRAAVMQSASPGAMLAVKASESVVGRLLIPGIVIAVINSPVSTVVAGEHDKISEFKELLSENNVSFSDVFTSHAFHSPSMQEPASKFLVLLKSINFKSPNIPLISNTTGNFINNDEATSPMYWSRHIIRPVHFSMGIESINSNFDNIICLEIGPGNGLCSFVKQISNLPNIFHVEQSLPGYAQKTQLGLSDLDVFMNSIANLWTRGCDVIWPVIRTPNYGQSLIPTYQFDKLECSINVTNKTEVQYENDCDLPQDILSFAYKQLFGDREINENKSFFEMGIDSLSIIRLIGLISVELKITLTVQDVFSNDTLAKLRTYCAHLVNVKNNVAVMVLEEGEI